MRRNKPIKKNSSTTEILKIRADQLARKKHTSFESSDFIQVIIFQLANEIYGIELDYIRMIFPLKNLTYIPGAPDFISGIINMRGEIISIVDLKKLFDLPAINQVRHKQVVIMKSGDIEFGIQVDRVIGVKQIEKNDVQSSLATLTGIRSDYLKGVTGDGMVIIDGEKILCDKKMTININDS